MKRQQCYIKKDDKVKVISGKDRGKIGKVLKVLQGQNRLLVEKINMVKRHTKPSAQNRQGGIIETEAPIHWSNVMLMCNKCMTPARVTMKRLEDGKKVRACKKCNEIIDA
ncbi:MAG: 50S ribosomal protein L24 [Deltaproteobacteria bacterium]|nr:50S ribosomal protein L24 [Deltaproteobacteria bacterium]MBW1961744.1 50S ribosomal protein L24 [Deltaproteobacteria bacterium]MBW1994544.1 50S ribosomal protein L24 [Deltaproteobacteria bacterium]MBW2151104.1 50S ribosomal protein L24 [Deltaproteobacteria bacterium]